MLTPEQQAFLDSYFPATPPGGEPKYSCYGYLILEDGTVRSIFKQYWHGVGLTLLFPEFATEKGWAIPDSDEFVENYARQHEDRGFPRQGVFAYQDFEIDHRRDLPVIVVGFSFGSGMRVCKGSKNMNAAQATAMRAIFKVAGTRARDMVITAGIDMPMSKAIDYLMTDDYDKAMEGNDGLDYGDDDDCDE